MPSIDSMKEKAGPLPVYGWVLVISVGIIGLLYWKKKHSAPAPANSTDNTDPASSTPNPESLDAAQLQAEYTLSNNLGLASSSVSNLATNVGRNTVAVTGNTSAEKGNTTALGANTTAEKANTATVATAHRKPVHRKPPIHKPHKPVKKRFANDAQEDKYESTHPSYRG